MRGGSVGARLAAACVCAALAGCELQEVTVAAPEDVVVVEAMVQVPSQGNARVYVLLHRSLGAGDGTVPGAQVRIARDGAPGVTVNEMPTVGSCVVEGVALDPVAARGTCYRAELLGIAPGMALRLDVETAGGERLDAESTVPGAFAFVTPATVSGTCALDADRPLTLSWQASVGARAYVAETAIFGLPAAFEPLGISFEDDPLHLLGLAIGGEDTSIVFPSEFGVFDRFDLDRDVALYLQNGVPASTVSRITVAAVDANYTNWVRGGNFNPSGTVRVPSVRGDGTGFFGTAFVRELQIVVDPAPGGGAYPAPRCEGG